MDQKKQKDLSNLCIKIGQIYTDIYILNCNMDISAAEAAVSAVDSEYPDKSMC